MIKLVNTISRIIVAVVFICSGFVKLVDPYGTAYKITDYIEIVHIHLPLWLALTVSVLLSATEFTLGMNALFKSCYRSTIRLLSVFVVAFFILTLYIAIDDPVQDCGCFGDALVISNWQTFAKNVLLLLMVVVMWRNRNYMRTRILLTNQKLMTMSFIVFAIIIALNAVRHLPFIDFRPYAVGANITEQMKVPEGMPQDVYETIFIYEKDGEQQKFTEDNYPWQDTTWTYVDSKSVLIVKGAEPPIHDFVIDDREIGDITEDVLQDDNYTFLLVAPQLEKCSLRHKKEIGQLMHLCTERGYRFLTLTSSVGQSVNRFQADFQEPLNVCNMDEITLKTMVRSYPGLIILKSGTVLAKYHHNDLPDFTNSEDVLASILKKNERRKNQIIVLLLALLMGGVVVKLRARRE